MAKSNEEKEIIFKKCPICKKGKVSETNSKSFLGLVSSKNLMCSNCSAIFKEKEGREEERVFSLDLSKSKEKNKYDGQALKVSEWERGISDFDFSIKNLKLPNVNIVGLKTILSNNEKTHWYSGARLIEERAVRNVQHSSVGGHGFRVGQSTGESHGELRTIDSGNLLLTNQRLVFNGNFKHIEYPLSKILHLEEYKDAIEVALKGRQRVQTYVVDEPHKWWAYLRLAVALLGVKSKGESKTKQKVVKIKTGKGDIQQLNFSCPECGQKMSKHINVKKEINFQEECPKCGKVISITKKSQD